MTTPTRKTHGMGTLGCLMLVLLLGVGICVVPAAVWAGDSMLAGCCPEVETVHGLGPTSIRDAYGVAAVFLAAAIIGWVVLRIRNGRLAPDDAAGKPRRRPSVGRLLALPLAAGVVGVVSYPAISGINVGLDRSPGHTRQVVVLHMSHSTYSKGSTIDYYLYVQSWRSDYGAEMRLQVPSFVYDQARVGKPITVISHRGALGAEWLEIR